MKKYTILAGSLLIICLNTFDCKSYQQKLKRSVFDIIPHTVNNNEEPSEKNSHSSVLGKAVRDVNGKEHRTENKKLKQRRKGDLKKQFMEESKRIHESKLVERNEIQ